MTISSIRISSDLGQMLMPFIESLILAPGRTLASYLHIQVRRQESQKEDSSKGKWKWRTGE